MISRQARKSHNREGARMLHRLIDEAVATVAAERAAEAAKAKADGKAARIARNTPVPFTEDEYKAARVVRDELGWHKVVRVNAKSITVETGYSWTDRIPCAKVIEVRS